MHAMQDNGHRVRMAMQSHAAIPGNAKHCRALPNDALAMQQCEITHACAQGIAMQRGNAV